MPANTPKSPPSLNDLLVGFVNRPVDAASIEAEAGAMGEVEPHEVAVGFRVDPRLAWREAISACEALGSPTSTVNAPSEWAALVIKHDGIAAQPFALGCYPQRVRDLSALLQAKDLAAFRTKPEARTASPALAKWAAKHGETGNQLLAASVLRAANDFDSASKTLDSLPADASVENERAALLWLKGEWEKAAAIWDRVPDSAVAFFNRGMSALFLNQPAKARENFKKAVEKLPESNGWHHLGRLYLALAEIRK